jgi:hypothetical protein
MIELHKIYGHISSLANRKLFLEEQRKHHPLLRNASPHFHHLLSGKKAQAHPLVIQSIEAEEYLIQRPANVQQEKERRSQACICL